MKNEWQIGGFNVATGSVLLGLLIAWMTFRYFRFPLLLVIAIFLFVVFLAYDRITASRQQTAKIYPVSLDDARQIVLNVLNEKGMPYKDTGGYLFIIEDEVEIRLLPERSRGFVGTSISLTPQNPESHQLVFSLHQKLDEAFRPRGL